MPKTNKQIYSNKFSDGYVNETYRSLTSREANPPNNTNYSKVVTSIKQINIVGILERRILC